MKHIALSLVKISVLLYLEGFQDFRVSGNNVVSTSGTISLQISRYTDTRLVVPENLFQPRPISKGASLFGARVDCTRSCATQENCHAFNVYEDQSSYVCELLSDNLSRNKTALRLISHSGSTIWEKRSTGAPKPSFQTTTTPAMTTSPTKITTQQMTTNRTTNKVTTKLTTRPTRSTTSTTPTPCDIIRPGCLGNFPNCYNCIKTCIDWCNRTGLTSGTATLWPDGDRAESKPVNASCENTNLTLIFKMIEVQTGFWKKNQVLSFPDMHRLINLQVYPYLTITFQSKPNATSADLFFDTSQYSNVYIGPDGTLANLTYNHLNTSESSDIFNLGGQPMKPTRYVNVTNDLYSCGSFWLLDPNNATYCPGGQLGMFGTLVKNGSIILKTGLRVPSKPGYLTNSVKVQLTLT